MTPFARPCMFPLTKAATENWVVPCAAQQHILHCIHTAAGCHSSTAPDGGSADRSEESTEAQTRQPRPKMSLTLRMDTEYGQDKAVLSKILQKYGVLVKGGHWEAHKLLSELMVWKQLPAPAADPAWKPEAAEDDEAATMPAEEYMAAVRRVYDQARAAGNTNPS